LENAFWGMIFSLIGTEFLGIVLFLILLLCSALISGSEVALFSLKPSDFPKSVEEYTQKDKYLIQLLDRPKKLLATILIANNFINIAIVLLYASLNHLIHPENELVWYGISLEFILDVIIVTFLILLFGEIIPKVYANRYSVKFSYFMAAPLLFLDKILAPLNIPMQKASTFFHQKFGKEKSNLNVDQLSKALELTHEDETSKEEKKILQGIVSFGNTDTKQVMKPRIDIFALAQETDFLNVVEKIRENGYSRIPVFDDNIDNIVGILYIKDLLPYLDQKDFMWTKLLRQPYFVPENKKLDDLLNEFKSQKNHLAIVVDEYGGTSGLISLEDIIEEIVGDISDEFDDEELIYSKLDNNTYVFDGKTNLKDFYQVLKLNDNNDIEKNRNDADTLAGFILEISENFPTKGQTINFKNFKFTIELVDNKRIKQIKTQIN
jgi:gliding motility-associated protein GldE